MKCSYFLQSHCRSCNLLDKSYSDTLISKEGELKKLSTDKFNVVFRMQAMKKLEGASSRYEKCLALPFWSYIDAGGGVWACSAHLGDYRFMLGNIYENSFEEIWTGDKRKKVKAFCAGELDTADCRLNCRMDEINRYLWELTHPNAHVNFI